MGNRLHIVGVVFWCFEPIILEEILRYGRLVSESQKLVKLNLRDRVLVNFAETIKHNRGSVFGDPATQATIAESEEL
jgi:hypothetical protein